MTGRRRRGELCPGRSAACSPCGTVRCRAGAVRNAGAWYGPGSVERDEGCRTASETRSLTRLRVLDVELAHLSGNHKIVVVEHQRPRDAVLVEFERHRIDRRLLAILGPGVAI